VASVEYRLSGEALFPAAVGDVKAAVAYLRAHAAGWKLDPSFFAAWGRSAGGYLAAMLGVTSGQRTAFDRDEGSDSRVHAVVDWYGPSDFLVMDRQAAEVPPGGDRPVLVHDDPASPESMFLGAPIQEVPELAARANPLTYIPSSPGLPPFFLAAGQRDPLVPHQQTLILAAALAAHGGEVVLRMLPEAGHADRVFEETLTEPVIDWLDALRSRTAG
jgi:acetyl esterase/lipase